MPYISISDLSDVNVSSFTPATVVEGYETSAVCTLVEGFPNTITTTTWTDESGNNIEDGNIVISSKIHSELPFMSY